MRTTIAIVGLAALLACPTLAAQETTGRTASGLAERFRQLDRDGDGKITRDEAGNAAWFARLDRNGDGRITFEEARMVAGPRTRSADAGRRDRSPRT